MVLQCMAVVLGLLSLQFVHDGHPSWLIVTRDVFVWLAIISTVYSGVGYLFRAAKLLRG